MLSYSDKISQFKTYRQDNGNLPYDFHSIMHYSNKFFSKNGQDTLRARIDPTMRLGQSEGFSALDVVRINILYRCPELRENCKYSAQSFDCLVITIEWLLAHPRSSLLLRGSRGSREAWTLLWITVPVDRLGNFLAAHYIKSGGIFAKEKKCFNVWSTVNFTLTIRLPVLGSSISNERDGKTIRLRSRELILNLQSVLHLFKKQFKSLFMQRC